MEKRGIDGGFRLGAWLVEPHKSRVSRGVAVIGVSPEHMQVLMCLVESTGEFVDRHTLRERVYPTELNGDQKLREAIGAWHAVLGDTPQHPRYITCAGRDGYSLIAHVSPISRVPIPERLVAAGLGTSSTPCARRTLAGHAQHLLVELRRRSVFRVAGSYLVGMWILLQVAEITFAPLHLPTWWITALTILAVVGLPIVITVAWTYEITSDGVVRDAEDVAAAASLPRSHRLLAPAIVAGLTLMALVTGYAWWVTIR